MDDSEIRYFIEAALIAAGRPLDIDQLHDLFEPASAPEKSRIRQAISRLVEEYEPRGITISEVASGFRAQIKPQMVDRLQKLWEERPPRFSRALFETLALVAYRQPITRGEIEEIRGVSVSSNIVRSLLEREWVRVVGHRDVPGRPAMFGTTKQFLDYFGLKKLDDLPPLADLSDWDSLRVQLNLPTVNEEEAVPEAEIGELMALPSARALREPVHSESGRRTARADADLTDESDGDSMPDAEEGDRGFEEIVATAWPDPATGRPAPVDLNDDDEDAAEETDASVSRA